MRARVGLALVPVARFLGFRWWPGIRSVSGSGCIADQLPNSARAPGPGFVVLGAGLPLREPLTVPSPKARSGLHWVGPAAAALAICLSLWRLEQRPYMEMQAVAKQRKAAIAVPYPATVALTLLSSSSSWVLSCSLMTRTTSDSVPLATALPIRKPSSLGRQYWGALHWPGQAGQVFGDRAGSVLGMGEEANALRVM